MLREHFSSTVLILHAFRTIMPKIRQTITDQHPYRLRVLHRHGIPALFAFCLGVFVAVSFGLVLWRDNFRSIVHLCGLQNARIALPHFFKTRVTENGT